MTRKWPLASLFPRARWVAADKKNAWVNSLTTANGIAHAIKDEVALLRKLGSDLIGRVG